MATDTQSYKNHTRWDPPFHFFLAPVGLAVLILMIVLAVRDPTWWNGLRVLGALWALVAMFKIRLYALHVQNRLIRLEERLRLQELLPASLRPRIYEVTESQLIALRFASDPEVPELVEKTLAGSWDGKQIKQAIRVWRPDTYRV